MTHPLDIASLEAGPRCALLLLPSGKVRVLRDYKQCVHGAQRPGSKAFSHPGRCSNRPVVGYDKCGMHIGDKR